MSGATIEKVRERVLQLARQIEHLSQDDVPPDEFFQQFLNLVVTALGARAGAVWMLNSQNQLGMMAGMGLDEIGLLNSARAQQLNQKILVDVLQTGEACTMAAGDNAETELPTEHLLVLCALHKEKDCVGVVQLFQRPDAPANARPGYLQFLEQMSGYASRYIEGKGRKPTQEEGSTPKFWSDFEQCVLRMQRSLDVGEVADTAASDGRLITGCDRMSVAIKSGRKVQIKAVSGQTSVNQRANLIRAMTALAKQVIAMREPLIYTGKIENLAPQIERPLADYVQESGSRMVMVIPLLETSPLVRMEEDEDRRKKLERKRKAIGCLVVEQVAESQPAPHLEHRVELVADHVAAALTNSRQHQRIFLLPVWKMFGRFIEWFHGRRVAATLAILAGVALVIAALVLVPWDYRVIGHGKLMPVRQVAVFAPWNGEVLEPRIDGGDRVKKGDELVRLRNEELEEEYTLASEEMKIKRQLLESLSAKRQQAEASDEPEKSLEFQTQYLQTELELRAAEERYKILRRRIDKLIVRAPIDGVVPDFQLKQLLGNRAVQAGQLLFHVMDDEGEWHLEMQVEEKRMGHLLRAVEHDSKVGVSGGREIEFVMATMPTEHYFGHVSWIATRAQTDPELGSVVEVFGNPDDLNSLPIRSIGAEVRSKISCGERSLGYVLFGDVVEFVQKYFWL